MPFAGGKGSIAFLAQDFGDGGSMRRDATAHVGKAGVKIGYGSHAYGVVIAAGQQTGPGRRAQGRGVEVVIPDTTPGQPVEIRCLDSRSIAAEMAETGIIQQNHHYVRAAVFRTFWIRPPGLRLFYCAADFAFELLKTAHIFLLSCFVLPTRA